MEGAFDWEWDLLWKCGHLQDLNKARKTPGHALFINLNIQF